MDLPEGRADEAGTLEVMFLFESPRDCGGALVQ